MVGERRAGDPDLTMTNEITPNDNEPTPDDNEPTPPAGGGGPEDPTGEQPTAGAGGAATGGGPEDPTREQPTATQQQPGPRRLFRSRGDRVIGGVCSGIAKYLGIDPVIVRVATIALVFVGGLGAFGYL